ncbi:MAG TPA: hypothetical protein VKV19_05245 [Ktedonobacteraceae bacterium]|nr:hypothetical protein [Ktedonobacteraceae bacterium]
MGILHGGLFVDAEYPSNGSTTPPWVRQLRYARENRQTMLLPGLPDLLSLGAGYGTSQGLLVQCGDHLALFFWTQHAFQIGMMPRQNLLQRLAHMVNNMPAIGNLKRLRSPTVGPIGKGRATPG